MDVSAAHLVRILLRATVHQDRAREARAQERLRSGSVQEARRYSLEQAVAFANRMAIESPGYRERLQRDGLATRVAIENWSRLPILTKNDFRQNTDSWFGEPVRAGNVTWTYTSGSTGQPFKFPVSRAGQRADSAAMELNLEAIGWRAPLRRATLKVEPLQPKGLRKFLGLLMGERDIGFLAADFRSEQVPGMVERIGRERISYLRGYAASVYLFAHEVLRQKLSCPIPLIVTLGEGLAPEQAEVIERAFGGKVYRDYGGSEAMHIGFECRQHRGYHLDLARFHVELLREGRPAERGENGDIIVTAFRDPAMPLVRYRIGDVGRWPADDAPCPCGNRFPLMAEVLGRSADVAITASGLLINLNLLGGIFRYAFEDIAQYQLVQKEPDRFDVLWVPRHDRADDRIPALQRELAAMVGKTVTFDWRKVSEILPERSGKRRALIPLK
ncbi:MAG: hypothetical protein ABI640_02285 [Gammaproteobacteria bacterium]